MRTYVARIASASLKATLVALALAGAALWMAREQKRGLEPAQSCASRGRAEAVCRTLAIAGTLAAPACQGHGRGGRIC